ncbi:hypothetical protein [Neobacillus sp. YIM B06451]|uniref:hypothetical protein n=1 Tax=Neobacillus sp. YIM B06451 TaxID=3070994 RepID=UPI00292D2A15|nr:hypothetical protein [Neobacillus sp. YIM B06451]
MKPWLNVLVEFHPVNEGGKNAVRLGDYLYGDRYLNGYRPHFRIIGETEYLGIQFLSGPEGLIRPKEKVNAKVSLLYYPQVPYDKLCDGIEFEIFEGANIVGTGKVIGSLQFD